MRYRTETGREESLRVAGPDDLRVLHALVGVSLGRDLPGPRIQDPEFPVFALGGGKLAHRLPRDALNLVAVILREHNFVYSWWLSFMEI